MPAAVILGGGDPSRGETGTPREAIDDDGDGVPDLSDPFPLDFYNGLTTHLPVVYSGESPGGSGLFGSGFTGLMINHRTHYEDLFDAGSVATGVDGSLLSVSAVPPGDAFALVNTQEYAFQFGVNTTIATGPFTVSTQVNVPWSGEATPHDYQSLGLFIGTGDQDNYVKVVLSANGGLGGVEVLWEDAAFAWGTIYAVDPLGHAPVTLFLHVNPANGTAFPKFRLEGGQVINLGNPLPLYGDLLAAVRGGAPLAVGVIATSAGTDPFPANWKFISVTSDPSTVHGQMSVTPEGSLDSSTAATDAFAVTNDSTAGERIVRITIDLSTAILPDVVFDPFGLAGDTFGKDFTPDTGAAAAGLLGHTFLSPHDDGFDILEIDFSNFDPGESFGFSVDVDPTSIQAALPPGPALAGEICGSELIGATVTLRFSEGSVRIGQLSAIPGDEGGALALVSSALPPAPLVEAVGVPAPDVVYESDQIIRIAGPAGATAALLVTEGGLFTDEVPAGGFDLDPFEANRLVQTAQTTAVIGPDDYVDVPVTLTRSSPEAGLNSIAAVVLAGAAHGAVSEVLTLALRNPDLMAAPFPLEFANVGLGRPVIATILLENQAGADLQVGGLAVEGSDFWLDGPAGPFVVPAAGPGVSVSVGFKPSRVEYGLSGALVVTHDGDNSPLRVPLSGAGVFTPGSVLYRVNAGGPELSAADGSLPAWSADTVAAPSPYVNAVETGNTVFVTSTSVALGAGLPLGVPDALFQSERWDAAADPALAWAFPVAPDTAVEVRLYLAEIFDTVTAAGQRVFNVNVEGGQVLRHFDAFAEFGGFVGGMHVSRMVVGPDGVLDVNLERVLQNPTIKGIEIVSMNDCADDDVTLIDYAAFHDCFTGVAGDPDPERTPHGECTFCFDDGDGDIDLADFAVFQAAFGS